MTASQDIYTAAKGIMADVNTAIARTLTQAPTNYGSDFRIPAGEGRYQVQVVTERAYGANSNVQYPRAIVTVLIHHYVTSLTDEENHLHADMPEAISRLTSTSTWDAETGVYGLEPGVEPEVSDGERVGNVITFEITASVLADPV